MDMSKLLNCKFCEKILKDPIILPCCSKRICKTCIATYLNSEKKVECFLCKKVYDLPPDSDLKKDDEFRELLNKGLQNFKPSKEYSILIRDLNGTKLQIENLIDDPSNFIANQFQDIIAKVDLRKEEINKYLRKIIEEIEESKKQKRPIKTGQAGIPKTTNNKQLYCDKSPHVFPRLPPRSP